MISSLVDTRYLEAFLAVCDEGTLARAALRIHKTQPAISYNIRQLEEALGVRLFERSGRRLLLTRHGHRLRALGQHYAAAFRQFREHAGGSLPDTDGIRIATVSGFGRYVLYPRLRDLARTTDARVVLLFRTAAEVLRMIEDGEIDCGAVYHTKVSNRLAFTSVYEEELVLIVPKTMRPSASMWRQLHTYTQVPFVTYEESDYVFGRWFDVYFRRQPASGIVRWHVTELEEVIDAVGSGCGVSIVPRDAVPRTSKAVTIVRPGSRRCLNRVFRVRRVGSVQPALVDQLFDRIP